MSGTWRRGAAGGGAGVGGGRWEKGGDPCGAQPRGLAELGSHRPDLGAEREELMRVRAELLLDRVADGRLDTSQRLAGGVADERRLEERVLHGADRHRD